VGEPLAVPNVTPDGLRQQVSALLGASPALCAAA
jgi:hypothetical protein